MHHGARGDPTRGSTTERMSPSIVAASAKPSRNRPGVTLGRTSDPAPRRQDRSAGVVLPAPPDEARATVERLRRLTPQHQTVSAGIASWDGAESAQGLVARADVALYAAKARGRDRSELAATPIPGRLSEKRLIGVLRPEGEGFVDDGSAGRVAKEPTAVCAVRWRNARRV